MAYTLVGNDWGQPTFAGPTYGDTGSLWGSIKRGFKKATRSIKKATRSVGRAVGKVGRFAAPALSGLGTVASFVPGIGTGIAAGLGTASSLARGQNWKRALLAGASSAVPGGKAGLGALTAIAQGKNWKNVLHSGLRGYSPELASGLSAVRAIGAGRSPMSALSSIGAGYARGLLPPAAREALGRANEVRRTVQSIHRTATAYRPPGIQRPTRLPFPMARGGTAGRQLVHRRPDWRSWVKRAQDTAGFDAALGVWVVKAGDYGTKIAKTMTGDPARWVELKALNPLVMKRPGVKQYGFPIYPGDKINLPASWLPASSTPAPAPTPAPVRVTPAPAPTAPPVLISLPPEEGAPTPVQAPAPVENTTELSLEQLWECRMDLGTWTVDHMTLATNDEYPSAQDLLAGGNWTERDTMAAREFAAWYSGWSAAGSARVPVDLSGAPSKGLLNALRHWILNRSNQQTSTPTPTTPAPVIVEDDQGDDAPPVEVVEMPPLEIIGSEPDARPVAPEKRPGSGFGIALLAAAAAALSQMK